MACLDCRVHFHGVGYPSFFFFARVFWDVPGIRHTSLKIKGLAQYICCNT